MTVNLSLKKVPKELVDSLKEKARNNHRSLQGEILAILEEKSLPRKLSLGEIHDRARKLGIGTGTHESTRMIREGRDSR